MLQNAFKERIDKFPLINALSKQQKVEHNAIRKAWSLSHSGHQSYEQNDPSLSAGKL